MCKVIDESAVHIGGLALNAEPEKRKEINGLRLGSLTHKDRGIMVTVNALFKGVPLAGDRPAGFYPTECVVRPDFPCLRVRPIFLLIVWGHLEIVNSHNEIWRIPRKWDSLSIQKRETGFWSFMPQLSSFSLTVKAPAL